MVTEEAGVASASSGSVFSGATASVGSGASGHSHSGEHSGLLQSQSFAVVSAGITFVVASADVVSIIGGGQSHSGGHSGFWQSHSLAAAVVIGCPVVTSGTS